MRGFTGEEDFQGSLDRVRECMRREDPTADLREYTKFGDVALDQCGQQSQYAARYLSGEHGYPDLGSDLRWIGFTTWKSSGLEFSRQP